MRLLKNSKRQSDEHEHSRNNVRQQHVGQRRKNEDAS
jgi:hypothetical protein